MDVVFALPLAKRACTANDVVNDVQTTTFYLYHNMLTYVSNLATVAAASTWLLLDVCECVTSTSITTDMFYICCSTAVRPRWDMMEVRFAGEQAGDGVEVFEVFCNPNAHATAFDAKLLITIKANGGLKVVCEGRLSSVKADLDAFMHTLE